MIATYSQTTLTPAPSCEVSDPKSLWIESLLVIGVSAFWMLMLPLAAVSLFCIKIWDTIVACMRGATRANPLILHHGTPTPLNPVPRRNSATTAQV